MTIETPSKGSKRTRAVARILLVLVLLGIAGVSVLGKKHEELVLTCNLVSDDPQKSLKACDFLLKWTAREPSTRSLLYRHRMRAHMVQGDTDAALREAELAIAADPQSEIPLQWKASILAGKEDFAAGLEVINTALELSPGNDYSLETKAKFLRRMGRFVEVEPLVEDAIANYQVGPWAWSYAGYFRLRAKAYASSAEAFAQALRSEPLNKYDSRKFMEACRLAGQDCPVLFPDHTETYAPQNCQDIYAEFGKWYPAFDDGGGQGSGYGALKRFFEEDREHAALIAQYGYWAIVNRYQKFPVPDNAQELIFHHYLLHCVSNGEFRYVDRGYDVEERQRQEARVFGSQFEKNLIDLAEVQLRASEDAGQSGKINEP